MHRALVRRTTTPARPASCPELELRLAPEPLAPWLASEALTGAREGPPFWAHAWPGGLALARFVLDAPALVAGRSVLDFASGCGVCAIAAAKAGARSVLATEIDAFALAAIAENAQLNQVTLEAQQRDVLGTDEGWAVVLVGDVFYQADLSVRLEQWLRGLARRGAAVFIGDPGRTFLPAARLRCVATYDLVALPAWDSVLDRPARVWQLDA
jgi:predicted nicotinamide N-methyase